MAAPLMRPKTMDAELWVQSKCKMAETLTYHWQIELQANRLQQLEAVHICTHVFAHTRDDGDRPFRVGNSYIVEYARQDMQGACRRIAQFPMWIWGSDHARWDASTRMAFLLGCCGVLSSPGM